MKTYEVTAERDGKFWFARIPELDGVTQGRSLAEVPIMASDYIALVTGQPEAAFTVRVRVLVPREIEQHLARARELRETESRARTEAAAEIRAAARSLHESGFTMREIGQTLEVSHQRAHQLVSA
jgi:predicted RNase H-like HicB family nuclease